MPIRIHSKYLGKLSLGLLFAFIHFSSQFRGVPTFLSWVHMKWPFAKDIFLFVLLNITFWLFDSMLYKTHNWSAFLDQAFDTDWFKVHFVKINICHRKGVICLHKSQYESSVSKLQPIPGNFFFDSPFSTQYIARYVLLLRPPARHVYTRNSQDSTLCTLCKSQWTLIFYFLHTKSWRNIKHAFARFCFVKAHLWMTQGSNVTKKNSFSLNLRIDLCSYRE